MAHRSSIKGSEDETEIRTTETINIKDHQKTSAARPARIIRQKKTHRVGRLVWRRPHCRREGISDSLYYSSSKELLEVGKRRLAGDTARAATSDGVKSLRKEVWDLKEVVAGQTLELRLLKRKHDRTLSPF